MEDFKAAVQEKVDRLRNVPSELQENELWNQFAESGLRGFTIGVLAGSAVGLILFRGELILSEHNWYMRKSSIA